MLSIKEPLKLTFRVRTHKIYPFLGKYSFLILSIALISPFSKKKSTQNAYLDLTGNQLHSEAFVTTKVAFSSYSKSSLQFQTKHFCENFYKTTSTHLTFKND